MWQEQSLSWLMVKLKGDFCKVWHILSNGFSVANINTVQNQELT